MNKALHALVYVILILAGMALYYEYNLFQKRSLLSDRNRQLEDAIVSLAKTFEDTEAPSKMAPAIEKDISPIEAKEIDTPEMQNLLEGYDMKFEEANLATVNLDKPEGNARRIQLRNHLYLENGLPKEDAVNPGKFMTTGPGTAAELIDELAGHAKNQLARLNNTRSELAEMHARLKKLAEDYNKLPPLLRQEKITVEELKENIAKVEAEKTELEGRIAKLQSQIEDLNGEVTSLKDEVQSKSDEIETAKEEADEQRTKVEQLMKRVVELTRDRSGSAQTVANTTSAATLTFGDKGVVARVDNEIYTAVLKLDDAALTELMGADRSKPLPLLELAVARKGAGGEREYFGRIRLRQYVRDTNYIIADILEDWQQGPLEQGDVVFAE
ncbi:MAG: hypothetical protein IJ802_01300 [Kiritimatiellae bacterium]|nr:hypothetical protein [Kiritimatiellia bacterium]